MFAEKQIVCGRRQAGKSVDCGVVSLSLPNYISGREMSESARFFPMANRETVVPPLRARRNRHPLGAGGNAVGQVHIPASFALVHLQHDPGGAG